jgi:hypothetical protein
MNFLPYADDVETIPIDEAADIQKVVLALKSILSRSHAKSGAFRTNVHVKTHSYARGEFRVLPNLPDESDRRLDFAFRPTACSTGRNSADAGSAV